MTSLTRYWLCFALAVALGLIYAFQSFYPGFMYIFSNAFPPFIAAVALSTALSALRRYGYSFKTTFSIVWFCFVLGLALWFLGELSWALYTLALGVEIPYPSIADIFWLSAYAPIYIALLLYINLFKLVLSKRSVGAVALIIAVLCALLVLFLIGPILSTSKDLPTLAIDLAYPLLDLILLSAAILGFMVFFKGTLRRSWLLICLALAFDAVADLLFSYTTLQGTYYNGHPLELFYHWGYILYTLAFYVHTKEL